MKKLVSIFLALALILSLSITVLADEPDNTDSNIVTYEVTFNGILGHTYNMYQIFTGDVAVENGKHVLSNAFYGKNFGNTGAEVSPEELAGFENTTAAILKASLNGAEPFAIINESREETSITMTVPGGYYLIADVTAHDDMPEGQTESLLIVQILGELTISSKHATITSTKKTFDKNDSTDLETNPTPVDSADYDIGDNVPFQLSVLLPLTMPSYGAGYDLTFHDQQAAGLTLNEESIKVYILKEDGVTKIEIPESVNDGAGYEYFTECDHTVESQQRCPFGETCTFCIRITDINSFYADLHNFEEGDQLIVEYTSELTAAANTGREGNMNGMFVCHPDGHTEEDYVTILTYEIDINKVDGANNQRLEGAEFELYKWIAAENAEDGYWDLLDTLEDDDDDAHFSWRGLDGGKYKLVESITPDGYNTIKPIEFTIDANHKDHWDYVVGYDAFTEVNAMKADGTPFIPDADNNGVLEGNVANHKGAILPETGAEGTFFLITAGTLLVVVACVFMITRKKMSIYED